MFPYITNIICLIILVLQQFLKKEFSEENIMFWVACEKMGKIQDKATVRSSSRVKVDSSKL